MKRIFLAFLACAFVFLPACSGSRLLPDTTERLTETDFALPETAYTGPIPSVFVYNPGDFWDTVDQDMRDYLKEAHEKYVSGDTSFTVQTVTDLWSKCTPVEFSFQIENEEEFSDPRLEISENTDFSDPVVLELGRNHLKGGVYSVNVPNLKTGATYYWRVSMTAKDGFKVDSELISFQTEPGPRILTIDGVKNARDIGGWETLDGKAVRQGLVYRSASLDGITAAGKNTLKNVLKVKTELDLRNPNSSSDDMDSPFTDSLNYINISSTSYFHFFEDGYEKTAAKIMRTFAKPSNYPIIFHCAGGADRTGLNAFMLKALLGVGETDLICDYEITSNRFRTGFVSGENDFNFPLFYKTFLSLPGQNIQEKAYLFYRDRCGLSEMELANIVTILTSDSAIFLNDEKAPLKAESGKVFVQLLLRSTEGVNGVTAAGGENLPFSFEKGKLAFDVSETGSTSGLIVFTDGSSLPVLWDNS